jgi:hypothetical protein
VQGFDALFYVEPRKFERVVGGGERKRNLKHVKQNGFSKTFACDRFAQATGMARKIKALRFSEIALEILFLITYTVAEF